MPAPEANFWNTLKRNLPTNCFSTRIENRHGGGVPDVHFTWSGFVFWLELKTTKNNSVRLSPQQIAWNTAYSSKSGLTFILVKHLSSGDLFLLRQSEPLRGSIHMGEVKDRLIRMEEDAMTMDREEWIDEYGDVDLDIYNRVNDGISREMAMHMLNGLNDLLYGREAS